MAEFKPCPFYGDAGKIKGLNSTAIYTRCCLCGCRTGSRRDIRKAIEAWNTRYERNCKMIPNGDTDFAATLACSVCENVESVYAISADEFNYCPNCEAKVVK